jgi:hypothetical protein
MKLFALCLALPFLAGCADFARGFTESYNRVHSADYVGYTAPEPTYYAPPPPQPAPDYTIYSGLITQMGQPPAIYSVGPTGGLITQQGRAPIIISGY